MPTERSKRVALSIDVDRGLRRPADLVRLVEAVVAGKDEDEADWVEWKSTLDLTTTEGQFSIARQILGSANRHPDHAARYLEGLGYVIVGAEPGSVEGVAGVDLAKLDAAVEKYVGNLGPAWSGTYVEVDGKSVLVVTVEAPRWGDRFYSLAKTFQPGKGKAGSDAGAVFVRRQARTLPAGPGEMAMLQERLLRGRQEEPALALVVEWLVDPAELVPLDIGPQGVEEWIERRREAVLAMEPPQPEVQDETNAVHASIAAAFSRDRRSRQDYEAEVEKYLVKCRKAIPEGAIREAIGRRLNVITLRVSNPTPRNLSDVELLLRIDARAMAFEEDEDHGWKFPNPPKAFGTPGRPLWASAMAPSFSSRLGHLPTSALGVPTVSPHTSKINIEQGPPVTIELSLGDLRPHGARAAEPFVLLVAEPPGSTIDVAWSATSTRVDARQEGVLALPVADTALKPLDLLHYAIDDGTGDDERSG